LCGNVAIAEKKIRLKNVLYTVKKSPVCVSERACVRVLSGIT